MAFGSQLPFILHQLPWMATVVIIPICSNRNRAVAARRIGCKQLRPSLVGTHHLTNELYRREFKMVLSRQKIVTRFERREAATFPLEDGTAAEIEVEEERVPFDLDLAVLLAGFAFESYNTPKANTSVREKDAGECETVYLSEQFVREIFHGQLTVKLKKGTNFPAMDLWGLSDPYVVIRIGDSVVRSRTIWASLEPVWNETFSINVVDPNEQLLQVAAWDANIVSAHRRMGNVGISLGPLLDGKWHELELELEGMGGGGKVFLEVRYRTFAEIDAEKRAWEVPFLSQILQGNGLDFALKYFLGAEGIRASDFVRSALGYFDQINQFNGADIKRSTTLLGVQKEDHVSSNLALPEANSHENNSQAHNASDQLPAAVTSKKSMSEENKSLAMSETTLQGDKNAFNSSSKIPRSTAEDSKKQSVADNDYFNMLASTINRTLEAFNLNEIDFHIFGGHKQSDHDILTKLGSEAQIKAEASFMDTGLALPSVAFENENHVSIAHDTISSSAPSTDEVKQASQNILSTMEEVLGSWLMLGTSKSGHTKNYPVTGKSTESDMISTTQKTEEKAVETLEETTDEKERDEMRKMFKRAESAMEAWAMLAMSLGCTSFVKSEFEKICFIENERTDTQIIFLPCLHDGLVLYPFSLRKR